METGTKKVKRMNVSGLCTSTKSIRQSHPSSLPTRTTRDTNTNTHKNYATNPLHTQPTQRLTLQALTVHLMTSLSAPSLQSPLHTSNQSPGQTQTPGVCLSTPAPEGARHVSQWQAEYVTDTCLALVAPLLAITTHTNIHWGHSCIHSTCHAFFWR